MISGDVVYNSHLLGSNGDAPNSVQMDSVLEGTDKK